MKKITSSNGNTEGTPRRENQESESTCTGIMRKRKLICSAAINEHCRRLGRMMNQERLRDNRHCYLDLTILDNEAQPNRNTSLSGWLSTLSMAFSAPNNNLQ